MTLHIKLTQAQVRDNAMRKHGLSPQAIALKPGSRVEPNRKAASKRGDLKHKSRLDG